MLSIGQLKRLRWAVRLVLALGIAASVAANILHANPNPISRTISAWPPLALLLTVELVSRIPVHRRSLAAVRILATAAIAGIAGWISYWHMAAVAARYGETGSSPFLIPFTVDGLIVVASVSLVELGAKIGSMETPQAVGEQVVREAAKLLPVPVSPGPVGVQPATPAPTQAATVGRVRRSVPAGGRSGPQVTGPSKPGLNGRPLMEAPPEA